MASRPRRGKQMPLPPPARSSTSGTGGGLEESESDSSDASSKDSIAARCNSIPDERSPECIDDIVVVEGKKVKERRAKRAAATVNRQYSEMDEEDDYLPPPTPRVRLGPGARDTEFEDRGDDDALLDINASSSYDVGKIANKLIQDCKSWSDARISDGNFYEAFCKNIEEGRTIFEKKMKGSLNKSDPSSRKFGITNDMLLLLHHTKVASNVIRAQAELIGSGPQIFNVDSFLDFLKNEYVDENRHYSPTLAAANICKEASLGTSTVMPLVAVVGTYDRDAVVAQKEKRTEPVRRNQIPPEEVQEGSTVVDGRDIVVENASAQNVAKEMNKVLKVVHERSTELTNLYEFLMDRDSYPKTIENLFYFGFLVKDGLVSLIKEENGKLKDLSLTIKPEKAPKKTKSLDEGAGTRNQITRYTYILSMSPQQWKNMSSMSQGDNTISHIQSMMEAQGMVE